jgi:hypothetical protein
MEDCLGELLSTMVNQSVDGKNYVVSEFDAQFYERRWLMAKDIRPLGQATSSCTVNPIPVDSGHQV